MKRVYTLNDFNVISYFRYKLLYFSLSSYKPLGDFELRKPFAKSFLKRTCKKTTYPDEFKGKYNIIYIRMFYAYSYRLEYSGRRERGKSGIQICLWHRSTTVHVVELNH